MIFDKFIHIEEYPAGSYDGEDFSWDSFKHILDCKERYVSHTTRTYALKQSTIVVSKIRFCKYGEYPPPYLDELVPRRNSFTEVPIGLDSGMLCYEIIHHLQLCQGLNNTTKMPLVGACVFDYKGEKLLTDFEINMSDFSSWTIPNEIYIQAFGVRSSWFDSCHNEMILSSPSKLLHYIGLRIGPVPKLLILNIHGIKVEMYRVWRDDLEQEVERMILLERECNIDVPVSSTKDTILEHILDDCEIPQVGYTLAFMEYSQFFVLKFTVLVSGQDPLSTFLEVKVARSNSHTELRSSYHERKEHLRFKHQIVYLEKIKRDGFEPHMIASQLFGSFKAKGIDYVSHHTEAFSSSQLVTTKTFIDWYASPKVMKVKDKYSSKYFEDDRENFGRYYDYDKCDVMIIAGEILVQENQNSSSSRLKYMRDYFVRSGDQLYPTELPKLLNVCDYQGEVRFQLELLELLRPVLITLEATFRKTPGVLARDTSRVVMSNMDLSKILLMKLTLPHGWSQGSWFDRCPAEEYFSFRISSLELLEWKFVRTEHVAKWRSIRRSIALRTSHSFPTIQTCWKDFERTREGSKVCYHIPELAYDCQLPSVPPSFISNKEVRTYCLQITVDLTFEKKKLKLTSYVKIDFGEKLRPKKSNLYLFGNTAPDGFLCEI